MIDTQKILNVVQGFISLGLLFATLIFVSGIIEEYQEESSYFSITEHSLTNTDLPTATICFLAAKEIHYWSDFDIQTSTTWKEPRMIYFKIRNFVISRRAERQGLRW